MSGCPPHLPPSPPMQVHWNMPPLLSHPPPPGECRYVGLHKGPVSVICAPQPEDGPLGHAGLLMTGSVTGNIKVWDYQGKVIQEPTVMVQVWRENVWRKFVEGMM